MTTTQTTTTDAPTTAKWWITTGPLAKSGRKILGPFESRDLALKVRVYVEAAHRTDQYWVEEER